MRQLTYCQAIREAKQQLLADDPRVFVIGQGLWSPWYVGGTMDGLDKQFGRDRIIDTPVSENATTAAAVGAAINGMRPIVVHPRMDFMVLATDPIVNQAANWCYMFAGQCNVPVVIRSIINRGGEQGRNTRRRCRRSSCTCRASRSSCPLRPRTPRDFWWPPSTTATRWCTSTTAGCTAKKGRCRRRSTPVPSDRPRCGAKAAT